MSREMRRRAGGVLSRIVSKGVIYNTDNLRTTKRTRKALTDGHEHATAVDHQIHPSTDPVTLKPTLDLVSFSPEFIHQIILALQAEEDILSAKFARDEAQTRLRTLERRYEYVQRCSMLMKEWKINNRSMLIEQSEDPEAEAETVDSLIKYYEQGYTFFRESIQDVKQQYDDLDETLTNFMDERNNAKEAVGEKLLQSLRLQQKPLGWKQADFKIRDPVDNGDLPVFEKDCDQFVAFIGEELLGSLSKYPLRRTSDWQKHCMELEQIRVMHGEAVSTLEELENVHEIGETLVVSQVEEQAELVKQLTLDLKNAVEGVRHAGVPCRSDGSLRYDTSDYGTTEIDRDAYEDDQEVNNNEMTPAEIEEYVVTSRETVEKWLASADFENDTELLGPPTPRTPWTPGGGVDQLREVELGESFQYYSDSDSDII